MRYTNPRLLYFTSTVFLGFSRSSTQVFYVPMQKKVIVNFALKIFGRFFKFRIGEPKLINRMTCQTFRSKTTAAIIIIIISGFGIYGAAVVPDSGVGNTWQRLTLVLHEFLSNGLTPSRLHIVHQFTIYVQYIFNNMQYLIRVSSQHVRNVKKQMASWFTLETESWIWSINIDAIFSDLERPLTQISRARIIQLVDLFIQAMIHKAPAG